MKKGIVIHHDPLLPGSRVMLPHRPVVGYALWWSGTPGMIWVQWLRDPAATPVITCALEGEDPPNLSADDELDELLSLDEVRAADLIVVQEPLTRFEIREFKVKVIE